MVLKMLEASKPLMIPLSQKTYPRTILFSRGTVSPSVKQVLSFEGFLILLPEGKSINVSSVTAS